MSDECTCSGPGFCPRFQMEQQQYPYEVCKGLHGAEKGATYRRKWSGKGRTTTERRPPPSTAPAPVRKQAAAVASRTVPTDCVFARIRKQGCKKACQWRWVVFERGVPSENGNEETAELAQAAAEAEGRAAAEQLDLPLVLEWRMPKELLVLRAEHDAGEKADAKHEEEHR